MYSNLKFYIDVDGELSCITPDGLHVTRIENSEGVSTFWKKIHPEINNDRIALTCEEIQYYGFNEHFRVSCRDSIGGLHYGDLVFTAEQTGKDE